MPKNAKKLIFIFCPFLRAEMTSRHKNSSKTLQNTPKMVQNLIKGLNIYIGSPSKKKNPKILTQGKSCFFTVNATISEYKFVVGGGVVWKVIIVSALSLSLRDKERLREREIDRER